MSYFHMTSFKHDIHLRIALETTPSFHLTPRKWRNSPRSQIYGTRFRRAVSFSLDELENESFAARICVRNPVKLDPEGVITGFKIENVRNENVIPTVLLIHVQTDPF